VLTGENRRGIRREAAAARCALRLRVPSGNGGVISARGRYRAAPFRMTWLALGAGEGESAKAYRAVPSLNIRDVT
jgi:hypothetical protein